MDIIGPVDLLFKREFRTNTHVIIRGEFNLDPIRIKTQHSLSSLIVQYVLVPEILVGLHLYQLRFISILF